MSCVQLNEYLLCFVYFLFLVDSPFASMLSYFFVYFFFKILAFVIFSILVSFFPKRGGQFTAPAKKARGLKSEKAYVCGKGRGVRKRYRPGATTVRESGGLEGLTEPEVRAGGVRGKVRGEMEQNRGEVMDLAL